MVMVAVSWMICAETSVEEGGRSTFWILAAPISGAGFGAGGKAIFFQPSCWTSCWT